MILNLLFFFFQAEDGIRDTSVTGVQTCALPISGWCGGPARNYLLRLDKTVFGRERLLLAQAAGKTRMGQAGRSVTWRREIGRASCRERVEMAGGAGAVKNKRGERVRQGSRLALS